MSAQVWLPGHMTHGTMRLHNMNGPGGAQTPPDPTGSPLEAPDESRRYARTAGVVNA